MAENQLLIPRLKWIILKSTRTSLREGIIFIKKENVIDYLVWKHRHTGWILESNSRKSYFPLLQHLNDLRKEGFSKKGGQLSQGSVGATHSQLSVHILSQPHIR